MIKQLQPIRAALVEAIGSIGIDVFAQRKINQDEISGGQFVALTLSRSDNASVGVDESWGIAMSLGVYIENPATDDQLETLAITVADTISADAGVQALVSGILFEGHEYPEDQGDAFASLDIQYTIMITQ